MQLALWIVCCFALAGVLQSRPAWMACLACALWLFIPGVAGVLVVGSGTGLLAFHPASWFVICSLVVLLIRRPADVIGEIAARWGLYLVLLAVIAAAGAMTLLGTASRGVIILVNQLAAPVLLFLIASTAFRLDPASRFLVRNVVLALTAAVCSLAVLQYFAGSVLFYPGRYATNEWFGPLWVRWMGTTDHPLVLSMLLCATVPLVAGLRRPLVQIGLLVLMASATLITQSRTAALLVPLGMVYVVLRSRAKPYAKVAIGGGIAAAAVVLLQSPLISGLESRLANDTGSSEARNIAQDFFFANWHRWVSFGDGISTSYTVTAQAGLHTSLENAFMMYAVGIGLVVTVLYFGAQAFIVLWGFHGSPVRGATLAGLMVLVLPQTFSSLAANAACGVILWIVLALAAPQRAEKSPGVVGAASVQVDVDDERLASTSSYNSSKAAVRTAMSNSARTR